MNPISEGKVSLITGGAGFIGSHLAEQLARRGDHVIVIDDCSTGRRSNLAGVDQTNLTFIESTVSGAVFPAAWARAAYHLPDSLV